MKCLTRKEMIATIKDGGSVLWKGTVISSVQDLPTEAEIAAFTGDETHKTKAKEEITAQIEALRAQMNILEDSNGRTGGIEKNTKTENSEEVRKDVKPEKASVKTSV